MLEKSLGILFYQKRRGTEGKGAIPIYMRITVDGIRKEVSTGRKIEPERWNSSCLPAGV